MESVLLTTFPTHSCSKTHGPSSGTNPNSGQRSAPIETDTAPDLLTVQEAAEMLDVYFDYCNHDRLHASIGFRRCISRINNSFKPLP